MIRSVLLAIFLGVCTLVHPALAQQAPEGAESREVRAVITAIQNDRILDGNRQIQFEAKGEDGKTYVVDTKGSYTEGVRYDLSKGTRVKLQILPGDEGDIAYLSDVIRTRELAMIFVAFAFLILIVGLVRGALSLVGLFVTGGILFAWVFPRILDGHDPVMTTVIGGIVILAVNMHLSHGFNRRTFFAFLSTAMSLGTAVLFAFVFTSLAKLSGLANEDAVFLYWDGGVTNPVGLLLAGFILGAVGVLDDIAVTQSETVAELKEANPSLDAGELFKRSMRVGRHHIASTVNTLMLAYAGAAMPLILLFMNSTVSAADFVNTELVAEEIIRTLSGTAALVLAVPLATALAAWNEARTGGKPPHVH